MVNRKVIIISVIVLASIGIANIYWAWANKEPLCYRDSCVNFDPIHKKCDGDSTTTVKKKFKETTIELRYSAKCDASWSKAIVPYRSSLYVEDAQGKKYGNWEVPNDGISSPHFGNMGAGRKLKACVQLPDNKHLCTQLAGSQ